MRTQYNTGAHSPKEPSAAGAFPVPDTHKLLRYALRYAEKGWHVFPVWWPTNFGVCACPKGADCPNRAKHPLTPRGFKDGTTDQGVIRAYWRKWPLANVAIATGRGSGVVVVDIDLHKGGFETWYDLIDINGAIDTLEVKTGSGGTHLYIVAPNEPLKSGVGLLGPGIDTRAEGGYVVAPPSLHVSGEVYEWITAIR